MKPNRDEYAKSTAWNRAAACHISDGLHAIEVRSHLPVGTQTWQIQPPAVTCVSALGCGDCYLAALAHATLSGWSDEEVLRYAAAAAVPTLHVRMSPALAQMIFNHC